MSAELEMIRKLVEALESRRLVGLTRDGPVRVLVVRARMMLDAAESTAGVKEGDE